MICSGTGARQQRALLQGACVLAERPGHGSGGSEAEGRGAKGGGEGGVEGRGEGRGEAARRGAR